MGGTARRLSPPERRIHGRYAPPQSRRHATGYKKPGKSEAASQAARTFLKDNTAQQINDRSTSITRPKRQRHALPSLEALLLAGYGKVFCQIGLFLHIAARAKPCVGQAFAKLNSRLIKGIDAHEPAREQCCSL